MTKQELQAKLDTMGIEYDKRWGVPKLESLVGTEPQYTEEQINNIADCVSGKLDRPVEEILAMTTRPDGEAITKSGIVVPQSVLQKIKPTKWTYSLECFGDVCRVNKMMYNGYSQFVREYTLSVHGAGYKTLAQQFIDKNNR